MWHLRVFAGPLLATGRRHRGGRVPDRRPPPAAEPVYRLGHPQPDIPDVDQEIDHAGEPHPADDRGMINEFNVKHGYQLGAATVAWFLQLFGLGLTHNPQATFKAGRLAARPGRLGAAAGGGPGHRRRSGGLLFRGLTGPTGAGERRRVACARLPGRGRCRTTSG
jgi:hypothetical protein